MAAAYDQFHGFTRLALIFKQGPGAFVAEVAQFVGQPAPVDVQAVEDVEALLVPPENVRSRMIAEPEFGRPSVRPTRTSPLPADLE